MYQLLSPDPETLPDPIMDESFHFLQNPYPTFERYRSRSPVTWSARGNQWIVTGFDEAYQLLRDNTFGKKMDLWKHPNLTARWFLRFLRARNAGNMLLQDPPQHTRVRTIMQSAFSPSTIRSLEAHIQNITDKMLSAIEPGECGDLLAQLAFPLPVTVIAELLGIPSSDREQFKRWSTQMTASLRGNVCPYRALKSFQASRELRSYLSKIAKVKASHPANDLLSTLVEAQSQGDGRLSEAELLSNSVLLLIAGHETTVNLIGNGVYNLLRHPQQKELLLQNPELIEGAVDEFLRFDPPVQMVRRVAYREMIMCGQRIRPADGFTILIAACNRDPRKFDRPDQLDIQRDKCKHLSFGAGIHYCLGAELARCEARIAISSLMRRFPSMQLQAGPVIYKGPFALRGLQQLAVIY